MVTALISNGDEETAEGRLRSNALNALCDMNPGQAISTRTLCVEMGKMPSLMLKLSLKDPNDLVSVTNTVNLLNLNEFICLVWMFSSSILMFLLFQNLDCIRFRTATG